MADAAAKHGSIRKTPPGGRRRLGKEAKGSAARLFLTRMPQKKKRTSCRLGPKVQPSAFGKAEILEIAADFKNSGGKRPACQCRFRKP